MGFSINNKLVFIDSFQFLTFSLDSLVKKLGKDDFKYLSQECNSDVLYIVQQKVFYPYDYMSIFEKFQEKLSSKEKFCSLLTSAKISDKYYEHVLKVWNKFEMKTMKDYHDLYLKFHILLLADVFEKFRNSILKKYGLCPSHYFRAPTLSWDATLSMTKVELELTSGADMNLFFEKGMRSGVSYFSKRYSKAINKYIKSYDLKQEAKHIIYLENNFYLVMLCLNFFQ